MMSLLRLPHVALMMMSLLRLPHVALMMMFLLKLSHESDDGPAGHHLHVFAVIATTF